MSNDGTCGDSGVCQTNTVSIARTLSTLRENEAAALDPPHMHVVTYSPTRTRMHARGRTHARTDVHLARVRACQCDVAAACAAAGGGFARFLSTLCITLRLCGLIQFQFYYVCAFTLGTLRVFGCPSRRRPANAAAKQRTRTRVHQLHILACVRDFNQSNNNMKRMQVFA